MVSLMGSKLLTRMHKTEYALESRIPTQKFCPKLEKSQAEKTSTSLLMSSVCSSLVYTARHTLAYDWLHCLLFTIPPILLTVPINISGYNALGCQVD